MYFQNRYLRENRTFPAMAGLETIDLPNKGFLSGIELRVWGVPGAGTGNPDVWLHDQLTRIELIVNGSQVVKQLDGRQLLADMLYKKTPHYSHRFANLAATSAEEYFHINLGRHYHDLDYMLDLSRVNDPELRITHDFNLASQNNWGNGVAMSTEPQYSIICHLLRDAPFTPKGYIKTSEIYRFNNATNHQENMTIPRGPMYSNLYLQSWYKGMGLTTILDHYELNINSDDVIPVRTALTELLAEVVRMYGLFITTQECYWTGGQAYPVPLEVGSYFGQLAGEAGGLDTDLRLQNLRGLLNAGAFRALTTGLAIASVVDVMISYLGSLPFAVAAIPYFDPWDERTWIDSSKLGDFWLRVEETAGATAGVCKLLADEVVTTYL